ncbi:MAG: hypothetical protein JNK30_16455 [Phenylobacterium sp.]|uniref:hypothetical protein n=1 Tax=Phenylobacterium sp. TaxID=1871053 RepID=UPI001A4B4F7A|nr:hypothetical protein [Phenylobacterium sp.]MBL8772975.1 hypothetical protein [Phenylobacterium sp.]
MALSDNFLQFVPADANWQPSAEAADRACRVARELYPDADEINAEFFDCPQVFVPLGFWDGPRCPACGADIEAWWYDVAGAASEHDFTDLSVVTPCCGTTTTLDACSDDHKPRFGRFVLSLMNPGFDDPPDVEAAIAEALGAPVNHVWFHL